MDSKSKVKDAKSKVKDTTLDRWTALTGPKLLSRSEFKVFPSFRDTIFGTVARGVHIQSKKAVVVKEFLKEKINFCVTEDARKEFEIHHRLSTGSENIVQLYGVIVEEKKKCLVMEYCSNGDLFDFIQKHNLEDEKKLQGFFKDVLHGLADMHRAGYAHRDISLENVVVDKTNKAKICDFGCATPDRVIPAGSVPCGKVSYMAPEVYRRRKYDPFLADIYSCGILLFGMLARSFPYNVVDDTLHVELMTKGVALHAKKHGLKMSNSVVDLLQHMICPAEKRANINFILNHPWVSAKTF